MPEVKNEVDSSLRSIVPRLVIEGVIEDDAFVLRKLLRFVSDAHPCTFGAHKWQVDPQLLPCGAIMRSNVGAWGEGGEKGMEIVPRYHIL